MKDKKRVKYFRKQKFLGALLVVTGILTVIISGGDITTALLLVPMGLYIVFTKEAVLLDDYFYETEENNYNEWRES